VGAGAVLRFELASKKQKRAQQREEKRVQKKRKRRAQKKKSTNLTIKGMDQVLKK
jgi:hypothetical protein